MLPISQVDPWEAWERVCENAGCGGSDGVAVTQFAPRAHRLLPRLATAPIWKARKTRRAGAEEAVLLAIASFSMVWGGWENGPWRGEVRGFDGSD